MSVADMWSKVFQPIEGVLGMSQDFMDAELFADFIVEAKEHLETIEPNLLELEKAPDNLGLLNEIFRPMHSLKGASGFLGLNRINQLAHKSENILDELRKGTMVVTSEIMDVILASTDALRQMIDNLEAENTEGDVEIDTIIAQIDAIMAGDTPPENDAAPEVEETSAAETHSLEAEALDETPVVPQPKDEGATGAKAQTGESRTGMSSKEWIANLTQGSMYALTAFGEGHLKDFIDESFEIIESLNSGLLKLEGNPTGQDALVNDLFRFFHNLKGNSGIIGFQELNSLTHEAETLLNNVRKGEMPPTHELIDLLLFVVDVMESLVQKIDPNNGSVQPFDISAVLTQLRQALAGGPIALPAGLGAQVAAADDDASVPESDVPAEASSKESVEVVNPVIIPVATDGDDDDIFRVTVLQQMEIIRAAMETLRKDGNHKESIDALYRSLIAIKNACNFIKLDEVKVYAERTAGIVDKARSTGLDFSMMLDLLSQEVSIINDMLASHLDGAGNAAAEEATAPQPGKEGKPAPEATPTPSPIKKTVSAPEPGETAPAKPKVESKVDGQSRPVQPVSPLPATSTTAAPIPKAAQPAAPTDTKPAVSAGKPPQTVKPAGAAPAKPAAATSSKPGTPAAPAAPPEAPKGSSTIRVDHEKLDHLMNLIGELIINRNRYTLIARHLEEGGPDVDVSQVAQSLSETTYAMARISDDLQDTIMKVRMVPVSSVFSRFPRLVRDLSRKSGKAVDLILEGEETELDKSVVEVIGDPLVHLIRNAVDHGVESEAERVAKGKSPKGRVVLRAYHKGNSVAIEIEDDGKGIDPEKMREVAVRKGILSQEDAKQLDDREAMELIFAPGFSSAEKITDISGRGVGMDVVRTNIKNLKGSVNITSEVGKGTRFTLSLPLTLAIIDALMVNVSGQMYAIPLDAVSETTKIESVRLTDVKGRKAVTLRGEVLGIVELGEMLNLPCAEELPEVLSVVVIHDNERRLGLVVDRLLERQEIVIKPLGAYLGDLNGISGATIMGDGSVILILDPHEVYMMATSKAIS